MSFQAEPKKSTQSGPIAGRNKAFDFILIKGQSVVVNGMHLTLVEDTRVQGTNEHAVEQLRRSGVPVTELGPTNQEREQELADGYDERRKRTVFDAAVSDAGADTGVNPHREFQHNEAWPQNEPTGAVKVAPPDDGPTETSGKL